MAITTVAHLWWRSLERLTGRRWSVEYADSSLILLSLSRMDATEEDGGQDQSGAKYGAEDDACYGTTRESGSGLASASCSATGCQRCARRCARGEERLHRSRCWQSDANAPALNVGSHATRVCRVDSAVLTKSAKPSQVALVATFIGFVLHRSNAVSTERFGWVRAASKV